MEAKDKKLSIVRIFDAPRELGFKLWSSSEHISKWYVPQGCKTTVYKLEFKPGGIFHHEVRSLDGIGCIFKAEYREIIENEKIVYVLRYCDENGSLISAAEANMEGPDETTVTVTFEDYEGKTKLTLHQSISEEWAKNKGSYFGWLEILDGLEKESFKTMHE
ncbi:MAG: SRPBCC domain-containing protein [Ignavibacteria bacterium]|nr:SRPBCC domain-containing protein [Ignavibacteria bacterium]